jgi:hypothetical protein
MPKHLESTDITRFARSYLSALNGPDGADTVRFARS